MRITELTPGIESVISDLQIEPLQTLEFEPPNPGARK